MTYVAVEETPLDSKDTVTTHMGHLACARDSHVAANPHAHFMFILKDELRTTKHPRQLTLNRIIDSKGIATLVLRVC